MERFSYLKDNVKNFILKLVLNNSQRESYISYTNKSSLRIIDNIEFLKDGSDYKITLYLCYATVNIFAALILFFAIPVGLNRIDILSLNITSVILIASLLLIIFLIFNSYIYFSMLPLRRYNQVRVIISFIFISLICCILVFVPFLPSNNLFQNIFQEIDLNIIFDKKIWFFWLLTILLFFISCVSSYLFLKNQNTFDLEDINSGNEVLLIILSIPTFIIGVDIEKIRPIGFILLTLVIHTVFTSMYISYRLSKNYKKADELFQRELLSATPNYTNLKDCYYHGGEKYKDKLLSTEKLLRIIKENEER
jgi:hypothetical protein